MNPLDAIEWIKVGQEMADLKRAFAEDFQETQKRIDDALYPLTLAIKRGVPGKWLLQETGRRWSNATNSPIRIFFRGPVENAGIHHYEELRPTPSTFVISKKALQLARMEWEPGFTICQISVFVEGRKIQRLIKPIIEISFGAISNRSFLDKIPVTQAVQDLSDYHLWVPILQKLQPRSQIILPTRTGFWRGFTSEVGSTSTQFIPLLAIHSWNADADILETETRYLINVFREAGWNSVSALGQISELTRRLSDRVDNASPFTH